MSFVLVFLIMLSAVAAMAVGVMFGREPIRGSCGGLGQVGIDADCELCGGSASRCAEARGLSLEEPTDDSTAVGTYDPKRRD